MEELQDAIEDAQYMNAMQDTVPKPTKEWRKPTPEEIQRYLARVLKENPKALEADGICTGSLGFYMFLKFISEQGHINISRFLFDVAAFRSKISANIASVAIKVVNDYLREGSQGNPNSNESRRPDIVRIILPPRKRMQQPSNPYPGGRPANVTSASSGAMSTHSSNGGQGDSRHGGDSRNGESRNGEGRQGGNGGGGHGEQRQNNSNHSNTSHASRASTDRRPGGGGGPGAGQGGGTNANGSGSGCGGGGTPAAGVINEMSPTNSHTQPLQQTGSIISPVPQNGQQPPSPTPSPDSPRALQALQAQQQQRQLNSNTPTVPVIPVTTSITQVVPLDADGIPSVVSNNNQQLAPVVFKSTAKWAQYLLDSEAVTNPDGGRVNALRVFGEPVDHILETIRTPSNITNSLFDELDMLLFSFLTDTYFESFRGHEYYQKFLHFMAMTEQPVCEDDFALFRVLGRGGFGMVSGCKRCYSGRLFAMKVMNKKRVKLKKAEALCLNERNILSAVDSPYVVCLKYAFTTPTDLYLVLDLMIGGDLGYHLQRKHCFTMAETKFYSARILLGIGALHDLSIVYRDLKPENVLMDEHGYTKISDLGLACRVTRSGLSGTCGTRGYWAPEMLRRDAQGKRERYSLSVDWFSFGCCIYEFLIGVSPFRTEQAKNFGKFPKLDKADKDKAIDLAIQEMEPDLDSHGLDEVTKDLLRKLLHKDGRTRLGSRGYRDIMLHQWFHDIDFDSLNQVQPPMQPPRDINMATQSEIGSFADDKQSRKIVLAEADHKNYESWLFISARAFQEEVVEFLLMEELLGPIRPVGYVNSCCCVVA